MNREIPYDENLICDICGKKGAFDFIGNYLCDECALKNYEYDKNYNCDCDCDCDCDCNCDDNCKCNYNKDN